MRWIRAPREAPLRVDFAGGWLDVPRFARPDGYIVNCAISPTVSLRSWSYERNAGLGGSGAWALLNGRDGVGSELDLGVGWQDPAVIAEGGLCAWRSGPRPALDIKTDGAILRGRMALYWSGQSHCTLDIAAGARDYDAIARETVWRQDSARLAEAVRQSYAVQRAESMAELPASLDGSVAWEYCGGGFGGYAVYLVSDQAARDAACRREGFRPIEPFAGHES